MADIGKIKERLAALLRKARDNGSSDAEIASAMAAAEKLMAKYGVSEADLDSVTASDYKSCHYAKAAGRKNFDPILRYCLGSIAHMTGVVAVHVPATLSPDRGEHIEVYGLEADVEYTLWLVKTLQDCLNDQWDRYKRWEAPSQLSRDDLMTHKIGFIRGFCRRTFERIVEMMDNGGSAEKETGTALVVKKYDLATKQYEEKNGCKIGNNKSMAGRGKGSGSAAGAGYAAGNAASLGRGVGQNAIAIGKA